MSAMNLTEACSNILSQLTELVDQIRESDFVKPAETLSHSTIGQHLRHTLEFFIRCLKLRLEFKDGFCNAIKMSGNLHFPSWS